MKKVSVADIDALLPQTQCGECNYDGCKPYAQAIADGEDTIDHCPPGGVKTMRALADLLEINASPYIETVEQSTRAPSLAKIIENDCIGCTKCIQACPVDAILGSAKHMHTVIDDECTGCGLCVEPCPVDCIDMIEITELNYVPDVARQRYEFREFRLERAMQERSQRHDKARVLQSENKKELERVAKQDYIKQAMARVKAKRDK